MAESIKKKKRVAEAFMRYSGSSSWAELQNRFPRHATEEKLAQFTTLKFKGKEIPQVSTNLILYEYEKPQHIYAKQSKSGWHICATTVSS